MLHKAGYCFINICTTIIKTLIMLRYHVLFKLLDKNVPTINKYLYNLIIVQFIVSVKQQWNITV